YNALIPGDRISADDLADADADALFDTLADDAEAAYQELEEQFGEETMRTIERRVLLSVIDKLWVDHLTMMDELRQGVGLQAYGQRDPLLVYKTEGFRMFNLLQSNIQHDAVRAIYRVQPIVAQQPVQTRVTEQETTTNAPGDDSGRPQTVRRKGK